MNTHEKGGRHSIARTFGFNVFRMDKSMDGFVNQCDCDDPYQRHRKKGSQDLNSLVPTVTAIGMKGSRRSPGAVQSNCAHGHIMRAEHADCSLTQTGISC
jgi:hypothetical protein